MTEPDIPLSASEQANAQDVPDAQDAAASAQRYVSAAGARLVKLEGRVFVRFAGEAEAGLLRIPYDLVPAYGVLAKPAKWRKMDDDAQLALVRERVTPEAMEALRRQVAAFVRDIEERADDAGLDPMPYLQSLAGQESADPAEFVFDRIRQRLEHAIERAQEERHAALTRESINLAEYPDSFEMARRLPRRFIAVLGPTNSGKTHKAMEALIHAKSGVYLAPLRLLA
ncbi:MAG: RNA helicase, partial [Burkholderiaceae bacterium]